MLQWFAANKDALLAIAALLSPVIAVAGTAGATIVSYRAVVSGLRNQREIARNQLGLTSGQLALQERTVVANLLGAADQKWIEDFRGTIAELEGVITERWHIVDLQSLSDPSKINARVLELGYRFDPLVAKVFLMVGPTERELTALIRTWFTTEEAESRVSLGFQVFDYAWRIIEQKQAGIAARIAAVRTG